MGKRVGGERAGSGRVGGVGAGGAAEGGGRVGGSGRSSWWAGHVGRGGQRAGPAGQWGQDLSASAGGRGRGRGLSGANVRQETYSKWILSSDSGAVLSVCTFWGIREVTVLLKIGFLSVAEEQLAPWL